MRIISVVAAVLYPLIFSSCGSSGSSTPATPAATISSGNWDFTATSTSGTSFDIGGSITDSGSTVSGTVRVNNSACIDSGTAVPVTGNFSGQTVTITSANIASQVITLTLNGSASELSGKYTITGAGCAGGDSGSVTGVLVPSISGTWHGTLVSNTSGTPQISVLVPITQLTNSNAGLPGTVPLTGTVSFSGSACFTTGNLTVLSIITGRVIETVVSDNDGSTLTFTGTLVDPATATQVSGTYSVNGGQCSGDSGSGTFTKQ